MSMNMDELFKRPTLWEALTPDTHGGRLLMIAVFLVGAVAVWELYRWLS